MRPRGATRACTFALVMTRTAMMMAMATAMATVMAMSIAGAASANDSGGPGPRAGPMSDADASGARPAGRDLFGTRGGTKRKTDSDNAPVPATVWWSDGGKEAGRLSFTPGVPLTVYDLEGKEWSDVELSDLASLAAVPRAEKLDREWRWKDHGNDEKVYTGRERPRRWLDHVVTLRGGGRMKVHVKGTVMYLDTVPVADEQKSGKKDARAATERSDEKPTEKQDRKLAAQTETKPKPVRRRLIIRQYDRGNWGGTLESLVYVKRIEFGEPGPLPKRPGAE